MVTGMGIFKEYFRDYKEQYVLIGGAACDLVLDEIDMSFRATKDLDIVLIVEALSPEFGRKFWKFIKDGQYEHREKSNGSPQFYRFDKPKTKGFPYMIELFARTDTILMEEQTCTFLHIGDEISSLSAILLNSEYYKMLLEGRIIVSDVALLSGVYLIPFKAKARLDLSYKKKAGEHVDTRDIKKHKNDIIRLASILTGNEQCIIPEEVRGI